MIRIRLLLIFACLILWAGCDSNEPEPIPASPRVVGEEDFSTLSDGVRFFDFQVGTGNSPIAGQRIAVHYTGWLENGTRFDSSRGGDPFSYLFGVGRVIPGWEVGVAGMREGGDRQLVIPPQLAYGERGNGPIPPNSTLIFEIELIAIE